MIEHITENRLDWRDMRNFRDNSRKWSLRWFCYRQKQTKMALVKDKSKVYVKATKGEWISLEDVRIKGRVKRSKLTEHTFMDEYDLSDGAYKDCREWWQCGNVKIIDKKFL